MCPEDRVRKTLENRISTLEKQIQKMDDKILLIYQGKTPTEADIMLGGE